MKLAATWFAKGQELADTESYPEAIGAFLCSMRMKEHPSTLFNAAQAARAVGHTAQAANLVNQALALGPAGQLAEELIRLKIQLEEGGSSAPAAETAPAMVDAPSAEEGPGAIPAGDQVVGDEEADQEQPQPLPDRKSRAGGQTSAVKTAGIVMIGVGAAGLVGGGVLQGLAAKAQSDGSAADDYTVFQEKKSQLRRFQTGAIIGFAVGGAAAGAGLVMFLVGSGDEDDPAVSLLPGPGSIFMRSTF